jgi:hypothetical protein
MEIGKVEVPVTTAIFLKTCEPIQIFFLPNKGVVPVDTVRANGGWGEVSVLLHSFSSLDGCEWLNSCCSRFMHGTSSPGTH